MAANSPFLRPLGIAAGVLGSVQAITWGILSLLGILVYTDVINEQPFVLATNQFQKMLVIMYFNNTETSLIHLAASTDSIIMTPGTVVVWTSIYFATSVIWIVISSFLLYDSYNSMFTSKIIIGWAAFSAVVAAIDFAGTVTFGVDYERIQSAMNDRNSFFLACGTDCLLVPAFMMIMCARGFILWIINVGLVIYLGVAVRKLCKKGSPNLTQEHEYSSRKQSFNSRYYDSVGANMYGKPIADSTSQGRQNTVFQPDYIYALDTQPPTVGNQQPSQRNFHQKSSADPYDVVNPITPIPRAGKTAPLPPLPTPQPDYSPPTRRQKHEPKTDEHPTRSAMKQSNSQTQKYF